MKAEISALVLLAHLFSFALRAEPAGSLDASFGSLGTVETPIGPGNDQAADVALQRDGKIVVAGDSFNGSKKVFAVARYTAAGSLDSSFNGTGVALVDFGSTQEYAFSIAVQKDQRILAAGFVRTPYSQVGIARFLPDGSPDPSFGSGGKVLTGIAGWYMGAYRMALQKNGRILIIGQAVDLTTGQYHFLLCRYLSSGALDSSFGTGGIVRTPISNGFPHAIVLQKNQKIVVAGHFAEPGTDYAMTVLRYEINGTLDATFGVAGKVITPLGGNSISWRLLKDRSERIYAAGTSIAASALQFTLARFLPSGSLDPAFGTGGFVTTSIGGIEDVAYGASFQGKKIILAGSARIGSATDFALVRYRDNGTLDSSFGMGGIAHFPVGTGNSATAQAVAFSRKAYRIIAVGHASNGTDDDFALVGVVP